MASWSTTDEPLEGDYAPRDPKPPKRLKASKLGWDEIREHFRDACCVASGLPYQHLHHIVFRSEGGDDVVENLCPLTFGAHDKFHMRAPGWEQIAAAIRQYVITDNDRRHYAEEKLGPKFSKRYPCLPNTDPSFHEDFQRIYRVQKSGAENENEAA